MPKKNDILIRNIFKNQNVSERKQIFTQKISELINRQEKSKTASA